MTLTRNRRIRVRPGFTLPEVLVGFTLTLIMVLLLTQGFQIATDTVRSANAVKVLMGHLNTVEGTMNQDFAAVNFLDEDDKQNLGRQPSDQLMHNPPGSKPWTPPRGGYFKVFSPPNVVDQVDAEQFNITSATNHYVQFTAILPGGTESKLFTANVGGVVYTSRAAEVAYFLSPMPGNPTTPGGAPAFNLDRRAWLVGLTDDDQQMLQPAIDSGDTEVISSYPDTTALPSGRRANTLATLAQDPARRMSSQFGGLVPLGGARLGDSVVMSNVLSFEILPEWDWTAAAFQPRPFSLTGPNNNTEGTHDFLPQGPVGNPYTYDTYAPANNPAAVTQPVRIRSLQISVRIWDPNTNKARQKTWVIDK